MPALTLSRRLEALRERSPQNYGALKDHYPLLKQALDNNTRSYPTGRQLYASLEEPPITSQTFGRLLALLADLEVVTLYTERSNANRYDVRHYDSTDFDVLAAWFEK
jgi:hypothetical protein